MKRLSLLLIIAALTVTIALTSCDVSYVSETTTKASTTAPSTGTSTPNGGDEGENEGEDVFDVIADTTASSGINLSRATTAPSSKSTTAANNSSSSTTKPKAEQTTSGSVPTTVAAKTDAEIFASDTYLITGRMTMDGTTAPYKIARNGKTYSVVSELQGLPIGIIMSEETMILLNPDKKCYCQLTDELRDALKDMLASEITSGDKESEEIGSGKEVVDGTELDYKEYSDGRKDYFYNDLIVMSVTENDDSSKSVLYVDSVSAEPPASFFTAPSSYTMVEIQPFMQYYTSLAS